MSSPPQQASRISITSKADLASALGVTLKKLNYWLYATPINVRYAAFELKRSGNRPPRIINAPIKPIKEIQKRLLQLLSSYYRPHRAVHGYVAGRSIVTHARIHLRQHWVLRVDLHNFFPSINYGRVRGVFTRPPFNFAEEVSSERNC